MRIISGKFKGRQLVSFSEDHIRPTTDRIKESIFNKLQGRVDGAVVLDLFSGTGNLAIESFSRGAERVVAVEMSRKSIAIIDKNLQKLGIQDSIEIVCSDVLKYLRKFEGNPFDLIFVDPPFTQKMAHDVLEEVRKSKVWGPHTVLVIEASAQEKVMDAYPPLICYDRKDYGDKTVSYFCQTDDENQKGLEED